MPNKVLQLPLDFDFRPCLNREDFLVCKCNAEALCLLESWPNWPFFALCIYGSEGSGKTHLAHVFAEHVAKTDNFPYKIPSVKAQDICLENVHSFMSTHRCLIVEDLDKNVNQEAFFHLYNLYKNEGGNLLFTAQTPPARMGFGLKDLQSRLNAVPAIEILPPDDELLNALFVKLFMDRQVMLSPEVLAYLVANTVRSFAYVKKLTNEIDALSLAKKRAITVPLCKEAIAALQGETEPDLFF